MWLNAFIWQRLKYFVTVKTKSIAPYETDVPVKIGAAESLFKTNDQGKIEKALVKSYHQPNDTTLDIELKDNIKFQNGQKLTAEKVKSSLENSMKKATWSNIHYQYHQLPLKVKTDN